ncbi:MAG: hypothetical protein IKJ99_03475 [Oscillospiraceae bacterium]|nr:hypothetical protein [Oscillospiraceae bacterium]
MRLSTVKELFLALTQRYFASANVAFTRQSRAAKPDLALVTLTFGNVKRSWDSARYQVDGQTVAAYASRVSVVVDLFTHGAPVLDDNGKPFAYEDTAVEDMLAFADFLGSEFVINWCNRNDLSLMIDGDIQELTGLVNDNNYEYRSRLNLMLYFTQQAVGNTAVLSEDSIQYPSGYIDENGDPIYTPVEPPKATSTTGQGKDSSAEIDRMNPVIIPTTDFTSSSGGSNELAQLETGYFTEVEIKEEIGNE